MKFYNRQLDKFWLIESTGKIQESEIQNNLLQEISPKKKTFNGKRYEAPLPWKKNHETRCKGRLNEHLTQKI